MLIIVADSLLKISFTNSNSPRIQYIKIRKVKCTQRKKVKCNNFRPENGKTSPIIIATVHIILFHSEKKYEIELKLQGK